MSEAGKVCSKCKQWKVLDEFGLNNARPDNKSIYCKNCSRELDRNRSGFKGERIRPYTYKQISETLAVIPVKFQGQWRETVVDLHLAPELAKYNWRLTTNGYVYTRINNVPTAMHRLVLKLSKLDKLKGDHENGVRTDNYLDNLRPADKSLNARNVKKVRSTNKSGFTGVSYDKRKLKWRARYTDNLKERFIGYFDTAEEAARAYDKAIRALNLPPPYFLNFPDEANI